MQKDRSRSRIIWGVILASILLVTVSVWFVAIRTTPRWIPVSYAISIDTNETVVYYVLVPASVEANGTLATFIPDFRIEGNGTVVLVETPFGTALNVSGRGALFAQAGERRSFDGEWNTDVRSRHPNGQIDYNLWTGPGPNPGDNHLGAIRVYVGLDVPGSMFRLFLLIDINGTSHYATLETSQNGWQTAAVTASAVVP